MYLCLANLLYLHIVFVFVKQTRYYLLASQVLLL